MRLVPPTVAIFITVFLDILSFGSVIPDIQLRAENLAAETVWFGIDFSTFDAKTVGFIVGLTIALYSIAQFLFAPILGRISDNVGRRPVLITTCSFAVVAAATYAYAFSLEVMWLSRIALGMAGANLGVAYAYASDISTEKDRSKTMGLLGMAFGLGFMFGPPLGAWLIKIGGGAPTYLGWVSAAFAFINLIFVIFFLPEPERHRDEDIPGPAGRIAQLKAAFQIPGLRLLLSLFFVANFAFSNLESTFYRIGNDVYLVSMTETTYVLVFVGIIAAVVQGGLIRILEPRFGEINLVRAGYLLQTPALLSIPFVPWGWPVFAGALVLGTGSGISQPSLNSLISKAAPIAIVGGIFGITQSLGALARIVGPMLANTLYGFAPFAPYLFAAVVMLGPTVMAWFIRKPTPQPQQVS